MAIALGKRKRVEHKTDKAKRPKPKPQESPEPSDSEDLKAIFARAFETKFKPLDGIKKLESKGLELEEEDEDDDDDEGTDWEGISETDEKPIVEVIEHTGPSRSERVSKEEMKTFMSSRPPSSAATPSTSTAKRKLTKDLDDEDEGEAQNLKNDLALQRLLTESHLLDANNISGGPTGKSRHKATDMRLQALGSKTSILQQEKMPMSHRKGINAKAIAIETKRRQEAKENGIILERAVKKKVEQKKRDRGVGGPGVGRFSGGTLKLSKTDVANITGSNRALGGKKWKKKMRN